MPLIDIYRYFETYKKALSDFVVVSCKGVEPTLEEVKSFESIVGFPLPDEFVEFTTSYLGGMYMEVKEELWPRHKAGDVGPFWSFLYAIKVFGIANGIPDWLDIRVQYETFAKEFERKDLVPFLQLVGSADRFCFTKEGQIVEHFHDDIDNPIPVEMTFSELLMEQIQDLEKRKNDKLAEADRSVE